MTTDRYSRKVVWSDAPHDLDTARITVRYQHPDRAAECAEDMQEVLDPLAHLLTRGFLGCSGVDILARQEGPETVTVRLRGRVLTLDAVVMTLRLVIAMNDSDPADFARLVQALDGDERAAREMYGGVDFDLEIERIDVDLSGAGPTGSVSLWNLAEGEGAVRHFARLVVPGAAERMPGGELEDSILRVSAMRGFIPVGVDAIYEPGDEEFFTRGDDLVIERFSIEQSALDALLTLLDAVEGGSDAG